MSRKEFISILDDGVDYCLRSICNHCNVDFIRGYKSAWYDVWFKVSTGGAEWRGTYEMLEDVGNELVDMVLER